MIIKVFLLWIKKLKANCLKLTAIFFISFYSFAQKMSLEQCLDYANKQNFEIKQTELRIKQAENTLNQSKKAIFPSISGSFSQGLNSGRSIDPFSNDFIQRNISSNSFGTNANLTLFNGFTLKNQILQNQYNAQSSEWELKQKKNELRNRITLAYMQVLMNQELSKIASEQVLQIQLQYKRLQELVYEGAKAKIDLIDIEAQLATAEFDALNTKNNIAVSKLDLAQLMSFTDYTSLAIEELKSIDKNIALNENYLNEFTQDITNQPIIKSLALKSASSKMGVKLAEASKYPNVSLNWGLSSGYSSAANQEYTYLKQLGTNFNQGFRIGLNIPIYDNGQIKGRIINAQINHQIAESQIYQSKYQLMQEINQAFLALKIAQEKSFSASKQFMAQQRAYHSAKERYAEGLLHSIELNTFRLNFEKANSSLIQSKYEFLFRKILLDYFKL